MKFRAKIELRGINPYVLVSAARAARIRAGWKKPMPVLVQVNGRPEPAWPINMMPAGDGGFYLYLDGTVRKASGTDRPTLRRPVQSNSPALHPTCSPPPPRARTLGSDRAWREGRSHRPDNDGPLRATGRGRARRSRSAGSSATRMKKARQCAKEGEAFAGTA